MKTEYQYIRFDDYTNPNQDIRRYFCVNKRADRPIGEIRWYGPWRQYCFVPFIDTIYSAGCLRDIADFIGQLMADRRR